jgi:SAM-dependent methyltransferase
LQFSETGFTAQHELASFMRFPPAWKDMDELSACADEWIATLRERRRNIAEKRGGFLALADAFDRSVRTESVEHLDQEDFPIHKKWKLVSRIHVLNTAFFTYRRLLFIMKPLILDLAEKKGRPVKMLELACGSGEFTLELARLAQKKGLPVSLTGSDYVSAYVEKGWENASRRGLPVHFRQVNAFDMKAVAPGEFDLMFINQSIHHFSPGQLAMMIAQSKLLGASVFVGTDGLRSLHLLVGLPLITSLSLSPYMLHDSIITARKLYSDLELSVIASIAAPGSPNLTVHSVPPTHTALIVRHDLGGAAT